ncbi:MAG: hypothetical protein KatS3mg019_1859 [Fimbriimonadales bacterium]|nr:MAG: hypothetical protein KatS3mg019_1859 [Fimbriimonadales bacterium]
MRSLWLCVMISIGLIPLATAQPDLAGDSRLQKPIAVWLKMEPLGDALRMLSRETGVRLSCSTIIQAHKVAIFIPKERPAHEVLTQLAHALRYEWRVREEENGYMLVAPEELRRQEQAVSRLLREARRQALQDFIQAAREYAQKPAEALNEPERAQPSHPDAPPDPKKLQQQLAQSLFQQTSGYVSGDTMIAYTTPEATIVQCLAAMPPAAVNALLNGQWVGLSTRPARGIYLYPPKVLAPTNMREEQLVERSLLDGQTSYFQQPKPHNPELVGVWMRLNPNRNNAIQYRIVTLVQPIDWSRLRNELPDLPNRSKPQLNLHTDVLWFHLLPYAQEHPFLSSWRDWATPAAEWSARLPKQSSPANRPEPPLPNYHLADQMTNISVVRLTTADALERFAWLTGTPVVADAFRTVSVNVSREALHQPMQLLSSLQPYCWLRFDESGYLLARTQLYWLRQRLELPEATLRTLERKFKAGEWLDLRDYVDLAATLSAEQVETLALPDDVLPAAEFPIQPLAVCVHGLRFLASLSRTQYQQALVGNWLPFSALSPAQKQRFTEAIRDNFPPVEALFVEIPPQYTLHNLNAERIAVGQTRASIESTYASTPSDTPDQPAYRIQIHQERIGSIVAVSGDMTAVRYFPLLGAIAADARAGVPATEELIQAEIARMRQTYPNAQFFQQAEMGYVLWFSAPPFYKSFPLTQLRHKPAESPKATK